MPSPSTVTQTRLTKTITCLTAAVDTLDILANMSGLPFLKHMSVMARSLITSAQTVRHNKNDCVLLLEYIHNVLYGIIELHVKSESGGQLPSSMLYQLGNFTRTLHKIHTFIDGQQEKNKFKQILRHSEMNVLLKDCTAELQGVLDIFKTHATNLLNDAQEMQKYAEQTQHEVLELIESLSDGTVSDKTSSINIVFSGDHNSSNSLSLLPSEPKVFHGRESDLLAIVEILSRKSPRIAILGPGGIGKTSLARAILHHEDIATRYEDHRIFVACDAASTTVDLVGLVGTHLGLQPGKNLTKQVVQHFSEGPSCLLVLDNLETVWEPTDHRSDIEEFLCLLSAVDHLALIVTMRGAERPAKVQWTRPFLQTLKPLSQDAARETFIDIVDDIYDIEDINKVLSLTGNLPLAIDLISHLVASDGCADVLSRWGRETTSVVSEGYDRRSNLDLSISLSLSSPRIMSAPHSQDLLGLLSMLPDGLSDVELRHSNIPIDNILSCKVALLRTSLVYSDEHGRFRALPPIREYMQKSHPPAPQLVRSLLAHFTELLELYLRYHGTQENAAIIPRITSNFANIYSILRHGLQPNHPDLVITIQSAITFTEFKRVTRGEWMQSTDIMGQIPSLLPRPSDHKLEIRFIMETFNASTQYLLQNREALVEQGLGHIQHLNEPLLQCGFYLTIAGVYMRRNNDVPRALNFLKTALSLAKLTGSAKKQSQSLCDLAQAHFSLGDYHAAQVDAYESQRLAKLCGNLYHEARAMHLEVNCWAVLGNYGRAISLSHRATYLLGLCGITESSLYDGALNAQAEIHKAKSEYLEAHNIHTEILHRLSDKQNSYRHGLVLLNICMVDFLLGAPTSDVQRMLDKAKSVSTAIKYVALLDWCDIIQADIDLRDGNLSVAYKEYQRSLQSAWGRDNEKVTHCLEKLSDGQRWRSGYMSTWTTVFLVHAIKTKQKLAIHNALQFLGHLFLDLNDQTMATNLFTVALEDSPTWMFIVAEQSACSASENFQCTGRSF
ncbi:hypothetical protein B0H13DRAFT_2204360 [Mycena leptocephala]|nr:hypothetical protein B0H13DRAFT_2204360 [Mycena leptocephala]